MKHVTLVCLMLSAAFAKAQTLSFSAKDALLSDVLNEVAQDQGIHFSYAVEKLQGLRVSIEVANVELPVFLDTLLRPFALEAIEKSPSFYVITNYQPKWIVLTVLDSTTGEPLPYAHFQFGQLPYGGAANGRGYIRLSIDKLWKQNLRITYVGYQGVVLSLDSGQTLPDSVQISMRRMVQGLEEVVILEYINRAIVVKDDYMTISLNTDSMEVLPGLPEPDVLLSTQMLPGVESTDETASGINIRGGSRDQSLIYWDRIPVYHAAHYFGNITSFIPSSVQEIEVYRNYIPARYSGASSGLLNIKSFSNVAPKPSGAVNATSTHLDASFKMPIGDKLSVFLAGRNSYNHLLPTPTFAAYTAKLFDGSKVGNIAEAGEDDELQYLSNLIFRDLNTKVLWKPGERDFVSASLLANSNNLNFSAEDDEFERASFQNHEVFSLGGNGYYRREWTEHFQTEVSLSYADYSMENAGQEVDLEDEEPNRERIEISNYLQNTEVNFDAAYKWSAFTLRAGYQINQLTSSFNYEERTELDSGFADSLESSAMVQGWVIGADLNLSSRFTISPEFRLDYVMSTESFFIPRPVVHARYEIRQGIGLKASFGYYNQYLRAIDDPDLDVTNVSESIWIITDGDDLEPLQNRQLTFGFLLQKKGWLFDVDAYYKNMNGLIASAQYTQGLDTEIDFADGTGTVVGIDFMFRKKFRYYSPWISYTWSRSQVRFEEYSANSFADFTDRPHQLRIVNSFQWKRLQASLGWMYKTGTPYSNPTGVVQIDDGEDIYYELQWGDLNDDRLNDYHRLDLSLWYNFSPKESYWKGKAGLSVLNLYNRNNIWRRTFYLEEPEDENEPYEIVEEEKSFLGFTPSFSVVVSF